MICSTGLTLHSGPAVIRSADAKIAKGKASSDGEKWRIRGERKRFLQKHSAIVARRNFAIFSRNAQPKLGARRRGRLQCRSRAGANHGLLRAGGGRLLAAWVVRGARLRRGPGAPHTRRGVGPTLTKRGKARSIHSPIRQLLIFCCLVPARGGGPAGSPQGPLGRCGFGSYA